jgi:hypothetical protein
VVTQCRHGAPVELDRPGSGNHLRRPDLGDVRDHDRGLANGGGAVGEVDVAPAQTEVSTNGARATTVSAAMIGPVFTLKTGTTLDGFTILPFGSGVESEDRGVRVQGFNNSIVRNLIPRSGVFGVVLECMSSENTVAYNTIITVGASVGSVEGITLDRCELSPFATQSNSVHHNFVCGVIDVGPGSNNNRIRNNIAETIVVGEIGDDDIGNVVRNNTARVLDIKPGNVDEGNTVADVC